MASPTETDARPDNSDPAKPSWSALAVTDQLETVVDWLPRAANLRNAVGRPGDLTPPQWANLLAMTLQFRPDLIIELGRGYGNSTTVFGEAIRLLGNGAKLVSLCLSEDWEDTSKKLTPLVGGAWFADLKIERGDILARDLRIEIAKSQRCLIFWDAHGFAVAEYVLGNLLPQMQHKPNLVIAHDMSDIRYAPASILNYNGQRLWQGNNWSGPRLVLGNVETSVEQAISINDFLQRNRGELASVDHDLASTETSSPGFFERTEARLKESWTTNTGLHYFSLPAAKAGSWTFPNWQPPVAQVSPRLPWRRRLRLIAKLLIKGRV